MHPFYEIQKKDITVTELHRELKFPAHIHDEAEMIYVFRGSQQLSINGKLYRVEAGQAALILPQAIHYYTRDASLGKHNTNADSLLITCNTLIFNGVFPDLHTYRAENPVIISDKLHRQEAEAFQNIRENPGHFGAVYGWVCVALYYLLRAADIREDSAAGDRNITAELIAYLDQNFLSPLTLDTLAKEFHVSKYYISHIFSEKLKLNFRNYLGMLRAEYAASLIRTTEYSMTEISGIAGFETQRSFNRTFSRVFGMPPTQYKKNMEEYLGS